MYQVQRTGSRDMYHRGRSGSTDSVESSVYPSPLKQSLSTVSLGSICPSLVRLFNHMRQENRNTLTKDDLRKMVGPQVDSYQLDQAFENLDVDGDGQISLDEFIAGFSRFWKEAPHTPSLDGKEQFGFSPSHLMAVQERDVSEERYEYSGEEAFDKDGGPTEQFQKTLLALSSHNRDSLEHLWRSLKEANPELLNDFEDFVAEVASEVEGAQRALDNQRRANKREAIELDNEIESRLNAAQTTLHIQTNLVRQDEKAKLERRLVAKESELFSVRNQLSELELEIIQTQRNRCELEEQCEHLSKEKQELKERLEVSERMLQESQKTNPIKAMEEINIQEKMQNHQEEELLQQKKEYEEEIAKLRRQLEVYSKREDEEVESLMQGGVSRPDMLVTTQNPSDRGSLMAEIVQKEGMASPLIRGEHILQPSPFLRSARSGSMIKRKPRAGNLRNNAAFSMSLPNLADVDSLEEGLVPAAPPPQNRFSALIPTNDEYEFQWSRVQEDGGGTIENQPVKYNLSESGESVRHPLQPQDPYQLDCKPLEFIESLASQPDYIFKILVVGNSYVGKSSFLVRLCNNSFSQRYSSTIGVDFYSKALQVDDKVVSLQLWDTAGQERFQSVTKAYYRGAQGVLLVYDISQEESFIAVKSWINSIQENMEEMPAAMCLVGNKQDLDATEREVSTETGETFAKIYGADFIETSAKTGYNVGNSLSLLVRSIKSYYEQDGGQRNKKSSSDNLVIDKEKEPTSKCCGSR